MAHKWKNTDTDHVGALETKVNEIKDVVEQMSNQLSHLIREHCETAVFIDKLNSNVEGTKVLLHSINNEVLQMKVTTQLMVDKQKESTLSDDDKVYYSVCSETCAVMWLSLASCQC